jgi:CCR4-NOT transcription complex subunit 10
MQEIHNLAIVRFLFRGDNLLPALGPLVEQIRRETLGDSWPIHPSWNLLNYHICLYHFYSGNLSECLSRLSLLWQNVESLDKLIVLCLSLLTVELTIRNGECEFLNKAVSFLQENFPTTEAVTTFLDGKIGEERWIAKIAEAVHFTNLRLQVHNALSLPVEGAREVLETLLGSVDISTDAKNRVQLAVSQAIPIAHAALYLDDQTRYIPVLESAENQSHFAILNNRGILDLFQKRYASSLLHFSKALDSRQNSAITHPYQQIIYNIGLALLMRRKAQKSFEFLHSIIPVMSRSPYLWLRLAECCVMYYKQRVASLRQNTQVSSVIAREFSTATRTFIVLPQTDYRLFEKYPLPADGASTYTADLNLDFAEKCTRNCMAICGDDPSLEPVRKSAELLCSFVSLELGDGRRAAEMGKLVYGAVNTESQRQFLAKIYTAQGYAIMGDTNEATRILSRLMIESSRDLKEKDVSVVYQLTFARVALIGQDVKKAQIQLSKIPDSEAVKHPEVVLTKVAMELKARRPQQALAQLNSYVSAQ